LQLQGAFKAISLTSNKTLLTFTIFIEIGCK